MNLRFCPEVQAWMHGEEVTSVPSHTLCAHVARCGRCQAHLRQCAARMLAAPVAVQAINCEACQADLAAYIDLERAEGIAAALELFPHVWWHLWVCDDCAEIYQMVLALQQAEAAAELPPLPLWSLVRSRDG